MEKFLYQLVICVFAYLQTFGFWFVVGTTIDGIASIILAFFVLVLSCVLEMFLTCEKKWYCAFLNLFFVPIKFFVRVVAALCYFVKKHEFPSQGTNRNDFKTNFVYSLTGIDISPEEESEINQNEEEKQHLLENDLDFKHFESLFSSLKDEPKNPTIKQNYYFSKPNGYCKDFKYHFEESEAFMVFDVVYCWNDRDIDAMDNYEIFKEEYKQKILNYWDEYINRFIGVTKMHYTINFSAEYKN